MYGRGDYQADSRADVFNVPRPEMDHIGPGGGEGLERLQAPLVRRPYFRILGWGAGVLDGDESELRNASSDVQGQE